MTISPEKQDAASLAKTLTAMCVRNTTLEDIHSGKSPLTKTGDYSDVNIIDANGNKLPWNKTSRINDTEMEALMKQIVDRLYTFLIQNEEPEFQKQLDYFRKFTSGWDNPKPVIDVTLDCNKQFK